MCCLLAVSRSVVVRQQRTVCLAVFLSVHFFFCLSPSLIFHTDVFLTRIFHHRVCEVRFVLVLLGTEAGSVGF